MSQHPSHQSDKQQSKPVAQNDNNVPSQSEKMVKDAQEQKDAMPLHGEEIGGA